MNPTATTTTPTRVRVRFFAAAKAVAGLADSQWAVPAGTTIGQGLRLAGLDGPVFRRSSFLLNGVAARADAALRDGDDLDVLPPYAGG